MFLTSPRTVEQAGRCLAGLLMIAVDTTGTRLPFVLIVWKTFDQHSHYGLPNALNHVRFAPFFPGYVRR